MIQCPRCGLRVNDDAVACPRCALPRVPSAGPGTPPAPARPATPPPVDPPPGRAGGGPRRRRALAVATAAVVVVVVVAGTIWFVRREATATADTATADTATTAPTRTTAPAVSPPSTAPPSTAPTPTPTASPTAGYADFADVYASVGSGVGQVDVQTCDSSGTGSGFLVDPSRLVTAAHVVNGASEVTVQMDDGTVGASIEGVDKSIDLAVLHLDEPSTGHVFDLGDEPVRTGTRLAAIGFPLGEPKTLTEGTVSGSGREIETELGTFTDMLQTDTAINPGNSGGPLVDIGGDVVGVAAAVRVDAQGIGFAIPSTTIARPLAGRGSLTPVNVVDCGSDTAAPDAAVATLYAYHEAINAADYDGAMGELTAEFAETNFGGEHKWHRAYETTYDDRFDVVRAAVDGDDLLVRMRFRSQQAPGYGPRGARDATCLRWDIDYRLVQQGGDWLIDGAGGHGDPAYRRC
ncbi:MAG: S1C family serine protease [Nocardioidaceae bacterium]